MASAVVLTDTEPGATISASNAAARSLGIREGVGGVWEGLGYYLEAAGHGKTSRSGERFFSVTIRVA